MEKQLLFLLDYDLRYNEEEACVIFEPFMPVRVYYAPTPMTPEQQETRAAAVDRVTKAGKARAHAQLPLTPPHEAAPAPSIASSSSNLVSTVRSIARRLSSNALGSVPSRSTELAEVKVCSPRNCAFSSSSTLSAGSWEMGSLIYDSGSSSSSDSLAEREEDTENYSRPLSRFVLKPVPAHAYRNQGRKVSDTSSIATVRGEANTIDSSPKMSTRRTALELSDSSCTGSTDQWLSSSAGPMHGFANDATTDISLSATMPSIPRIKESVSLSAHSSGSFLSRMWGAATKAQEKVEAFNGKTSWAPAITIVEPKETHPHGTSAFRRLVRSRSAVFRNGDV